MTNHIVTYRKSRGITQKQLADLIGVSRQTIVAIENGKFNPSLTLSLKLAREFECLVEDLFQLDDRGVN